MRYSLLALLLLAFSTHAVPTVTITATPSQAISPASVTLTWSSTGASSCAASGGWSGTKAISGTQTLTDVRASATYTLTCSEGSGSAQLSWTAPTTNTDGSPFTDLAGFKVYAATSAAGVDAATPIPVAATVRAYMVTGLAAGTWHFGVKASNAQGIDSDMSAKPTKVVTLASASSSAAVTINTKPTAPVVTVATTARLWRNGLQQQVGTVALGLPCGAIVKDARKKADWYAIPRESVALSKKGAKLPADAVIVAKCA
jgi:hypothetical protein